MTLIRRQPRKAGEDLVVAYLQKRKYDIIDRNFRLRNGAVDIIAVDRTHDEPTLTFIAVKTQTTGEYSLASEGINNWKLRALQRTALFYKQYHTNLPDSMRIDLVAIQVDASSGTAIIKHIKNIS